MKYFVALAIALFALAGITFVVVRVGWIIAHSVITGEPI